jgi:hypothetical protein
VFEKKVQKRIFGNKTEEVKEGLKRMHNKELQPIICTLHRILVDGSNQEV